MRTHSRTFESQPAADPRFGAITGLKGELGALVVVDEGLKGASLGKVTQIRNKEKHKEQVVCNKQLNIGENNYMSPNIHPRVNNTWYLSTRSPSHKLIQPNSIEYSFHLPCSMIRRSKYFPS